MDPLPQAAAELLRAEAAIRDLASRAASAGAYSAVDRLVDIGRTLARLAAAAAAPSSTSSSPASSTTTTTADPASYPRFAFRAGEIIKTGWSKTDNATYEHRSPWTTALATAHAAERLGSGGRELSSAAILREAVAHLTKDAAAAKQPTPKVPDYQVYVALGLLRHLSALEEIGRGRYRLKTQPHTPAAGMIDTWRVENATQEPVAR